MLVPVKLQREEGELHNRGKVMKLHKQQDLNLKSKR